MKSFYEIRDDVPIPERNERNGKQLSGPKRSRVRDTILHLAPEDSFLVPFADFPDLELERLQRNIVRTAASALGPGNFTTQRQESGIRVWRLA